MSRKKADYGRPSADPEPWRPVTEKPPAWQDVDVLLSDQRIRVAVWTGEIWSDYGEKLAPTHWRPRRSSHIKTW